MRLYTGCDIVRIARFDAYLANQRFLDNCFTEAEQKYCFSMANPSPHFAARFAGKEAVIKAMYGIPLRFGIGQLEIMREESGRPSVAVHGVPLSGQEIPDGLTVDVSLSHDGEYAVASAVVYLP